MKWRKFNMINVSFDFNPETNEVSNVKVVGGSIAKVKAPTKPKAKNTKVESDYIRFNGSSLKLGNAILEQLGSSVGERLCVRFKESKVIVARPDVLGEDGGGNLVSAGMTVACRGKVGTMISELGTEFSWVLEGDGYMVLTSTFMPSNEDPIEEKINQLDTTHFTSDLKDGEEVDFIFNI